MELFLHLTVYKQKTVYIYLTELLEFKWNYLVVCK